MTPATEHKFHIPVMGIGFTIDTPVKVAHFGISSVVSIIEHHLVERMREIICNRYKLPYLMIFDDAPDCRAARITAYLNLLREVVGMNTEKLRREAFTPGSDIVKYFEMLPDSSAVKQEYIQMTALRGPARVAAEERLRAKITPGAIDVNIMTKVDKTNYAPDGTDLPPEYSDALSALRGFANSALSSSVIFSAGLNPRLYSYCENFPDFFPDAKGEQKKKIVLKVSDYRSALIQGKFLAKKGLWVSEFRIESGLNCGGHAFATEGLLMGPILEEFREKRAELYNELFSVCQAALAAKGHAFAVQPGLRITAQGGIGTHEENEFLLKHYQIDATGWGSPFLLVPEATNVDAETLGKLATAKKDDYYISYASPLGVPFNNFRHSSSEVQRLKRIEKNRPGSPCYKKFLSTNTEFTAKPICTASREYQHLKLKEMKEKFTSPEQYQAEAAKVMEKDCLCEGLGASALLVNKSAPSHKLSAVAICPGPNLAYFSGVFKLRQLVDHIYGRANLLNPVPRPHVFVNELNLYLSYFRTEVEKNLATLTARQATYFENFKANLLKGIRYYSDLAPRMLEVKQAREQLLQQLSQAAASLDTIWQNNNEPAPVNA